MAQPASSARRCLDVLGAALEQLGIGIAHEIGFAFADHDVEIDHIDCVVLVAMDDACRAGDTIPWSQHRLQTTSSLVLDEHGEVPLQHEEDFLDLMRVSGVALARRHGHDRKREIAGRYEVLIGLAAGVADETVLRPAPAVDRRVGERMPVRFALAEAGDVFLENGLKRHADDGRIQLVASFRLAHGNAPGC